jgi:subtilase family serine protease
MKELTMKRTNEVRLHVESLEAREVLSITYTPADIYHAYGIDQLLSQGFTGYGQTIAIVDAYDDPTLVNDLRTFDQYFNLPDPPLARVNQRGGTSLPQPDRGWAGEITLDVEWAHAVAPYANILLVETDSANFNDLFAGVLYARQQAGVVTVSMSWGASGELNNETDFDGVFSTPSGHIGGYGLPGGITFVNSSGDNGAAQTGFPTFSPNVLSVGGTSLYPDGQGGWLEYGWSGSGGGISQLEPEPAYQYSVQNTGYRTSPDVSFNADPNTGYWIYSTYGSNGWTPIGGTSAAAPIWAALISLADQGREAIFGAGSLDGPNALLPAIYSPRMQQDFIDIVQGNNGYPCLPGYDLVTGLGSPWAPAVVSDLTTYGFSGPSSEMDLGQAHRAQGQEELAVALADTRVETVANAPLAVDLVFSETSHSIESLSTIVLAPVPGPGCNDATTASLARLAGHTRSIDVVICPWLEQVADVTGAM